MSHPSSGPVVSQGPQDGVRSPEKSQELDSASHVETVTTSPADASERPASPSLAGQNAPPTDAPVPGQSESSAQHHSTSGSSSDGSFGADTPSSSSSQRIRVKDLAHIQMLATTDAGGEIGRPRSKDGGPQYEISGMPIENIIEMVAGLLTKITTTNDVQHEHLHRQMPLPESSAPISPQTSSVLAFHGKNVPSITILSYLNRINKYCPTSYEVFLSLLVYFDRMTEKVNAGPIQSLREANEKSLQTRNKQPDTDPTSPMEDVKETGISQTVTPPLSGEMEKQPGRGAIPGTPHSKSCGPESPSTHSHSGQESELNLSHFFVVDSFNIHRLVIAGVTCASKFFSDIFYTNSRYAKVGGLPLPELNHLELQFLLLNDFRLSIPVEELEAYGTMLVEFYAREVLQQQALEAAQQSTNGQGQAQTAA